MSEPDARRRVRGGRLRRLVAAFVVRLSPEERAQLDRLAGAKGVRVGRLLVESALSGTWDRDLRESVLTAFWRVDRLLANVTGSLNQLAHQANIAEQVVAERQLRQELEELAGVRDQLTDVLREVR